MSAHIQMRALRLLQKPGLTLVFIERASRFVLAPRATPFSTMSWMDSWSRPNKSSATPPPLYLTDANVKYCLACGRVIGARRSHKQNEVVKYCSDGCRKRRLGPLDKRIDRTIHALLRGEKDSGIEGIDVKGRFRKGDHRIMVSCDEIENIVFDRRDTVSNSSMPQDDGFSNYQSLDDDNSLDSDEAPEHLQGKPPNPVGPGSQAKRQEGQRRAEEREMVRRAARRAVVFGFLNEDPPLSMKESKTTDRDQVKTTAISDNRRKCEAVMNGHVVEPSFAKGDWSIRWRES